MLAPATADIGAELPKRSASARALLSFAAIERQRKAAGVSVMTMLGRAGVARSTWAAIRSGQAADHPRRQITLQRLAATLDPAWNWHVPMQPAALRAFVRVVEIVLAERINADVAVLAALGSQSSHGQRPHVNAGRLRAIALYVLAVEIEINNAELARAVGCTRQNVNQTRARIEGLREAAAADEFLDRFAADMRGGCNGA